MERGLILDMGDSSVFQASWVAEPIRRGRLVKGSLAPPRTFWGGIKVPRYPIASYRCPNCGLLESYAEQPDGS
jgi:hypothetical protein